MGKFRVITLITSVTLCMTTVLLLLLNYFTKTSYVSVALANVYIIPLIFGITGLTITLILKPESTWSWKAIISKLILGILLFSLITNVVTQSVIIGVKDLRASLSDEYYHTEGIVQETSIRRVSRTKLRMPSKQNTYIQTFTLDNRSEDTFSYPVDSINDYRFEIGVRYKIVSLPYSRQILDYDILHDRFGG